MSQARSLAARWGLPLIIALYLVLGGLYAVYTPDWQAPDEPAHYNYVKYLAAQHRFPILKAGDYPAAYLEAIKAARFPPEMSIAPIRYEFHQPPLYYLLAAPLYRLGGGALLPLRFLSLAIGALLLIVLHWIGQAAAPRRPDLALGATAFVAFLPMHLAMTASVNNDILAELLLALVLLFSIRYLRAADFSLLILLGLTTGLAFVTKSAAYIALPLALAAIAARHLWLGQGASWADLIRAAATYLLPAVALALPWWLRNMAVYGGFDFLGLGRHEQVVAGQLRTAEFIAAHGFGPLLHDLGVTTFRSFWGQFGWMGVLLDGRLYQVMLILSALALVGWVLWAVRTGRRWPSLPRWQRAAGGLLGLLVLLNLLTYLWYNSRFVQHQGRYLFAALPAIALAVALGWREALRRERALPLAAAALLTAAAIWLLTDISPWLPFLLGLTAAGLGLRRFLPAAWDPAVQAVPYLLLIPLAIVSLFGFIVPQLTL